MSEFIINGNKHGGKIKVVYTETINIAQNTSTIKGHLESSNTWYIKDMTYGGTLTIAGKVLLSMSEVVGGHNNHINNDGVFVKITNTDFSIDVAHSPDGTGTATIEADIKAYELGGYYQWGASGKTTITLQTIARASTVSVSQMVIEGYPTITINSATADFTHTINWYFGNFSGVVANKTGETVIKSWQIPASFYTQIPNSKEGEGQFECITYRDSAEIGRTYTKFIVSTNEALCGPTLNPTIYDTNSKAIEQTGDRNKLVRYISNAYVKAGAQARNSATISSVSIKNGDKVINQETGNITEVVSPDFTIVAIDSRGYRVSTKITKPFVEYIKLGCVLTASNPTTSGVMKFGISGLFYNSTFGAKVNTLSVYYRYKAQGQEFGPWTLINHVRSGNSYEVKGQITGLDYRTAYTIEAKAVDNFGPVFSKGKAVKGEPVFDWSNKDFNFNVEINVKGVPLFDLIYPVGSIYMSMNNTNPETLFGGSWAQLKNRFLLGADAESELEGGSKTQTLTQENLPPHQHVYMANIQHGDGASVPNSESLTSGLQVGGKRRYIDLTNSQPVFDDKPPVFQSKPFDVMPPYITVFMWERIS